MTITTSINGNECIMNIEGRLDTQTHSMLENEITEKAQACTTLILDFAELKYIASAGLRVLLKAQKGMNARKGTLIIKNVNDMVKEVFDVTGFSDILTIE